MPKLIHCILFAITILIHACGLHAGIKVAGSSGGSGTTVSKKTLSPASAKPGETATITGSVFTSRYEMVATLMGLDGVNKLVSLKAASGTQATFVMPEGLGLGVKYVTTSVNGKDAAGTLTMVADTVTNTLPILCGDPASIWDNIDDYRGVPSRVASYAGWSADNQCRGIEASSDDANVWKDVTTVGSGAASCAGSPERCSYKDEISGQEWHNADAAPRNWPTALAFCDNLTYNGKTDWRLPTQKELMDAYNHGIMSTAGATGWISSANLQQYYYASSTRQAGPVYAWWLFLGNGTQTNQWKYDNARVICVRP
jgi:Protein of unknown function (DUF1566)